ncbi:hypothetical protein F4805DRAFT_106707 [Annulohypoxylon moriforme]|nr:hypothetical protein F4805DRAFT_106707 [Annulohypoxylon moriforme]
MSPKKGSSIIEPDPASTAETQCLRKWRRHLVFDIESPDGKSGIKAVGLIDGGSDVSIISKEIAKKAGLKRIPLKPEERPDLEGLDGRLTCQPMGYVNAKIRQVDLELDTIELPFYVVDAKRIPLLLGSEFNQAHDIETKISNNVKNLRDPIEWDRDHSSRNHVCVLIDSRSKELQRKEEEQVQQQRKENSEQVLVAIEAMKTRRSLEQFTSADDAQTNRSMISSCDTSVNSPSTIPSLSSFSTYLSITSAPISTAPSSCDASQTRTDDSASSRKMTK